MSNICFFTALGQKETESSQFILIWIPVVTMTVREQLDVRHQTSQKDPLAKGMSLCFDPPNLPYFVPKKQALICAM